MQTTANYGLKKPEGNDTVDIDVINGNMDTIDTKLKNNEDSIGNLQGTVNSHLADAAKHIGYAVTTNSGNAYLATIPNLAALTDGLQIRLKFNVTATGAITLNINNLGAKDVYDYYGNKVSDIHGGFIANLAYNAVDGNFILQGKGGGGNATSSDLLSGKTATVDGGQITGSMVNQPSNLQAANYAYNSDLKTLFLRIPQGAYLTNAGYGYPEINICEPNLQMQNIKSGVSVFGISGKSSIVDTADATATTSDKILSGYSAYANGSKISGSAKIKQNLSVYLRYIPNSYNILGVDDASNLLWCWDYSNTMAYSYNSSGTIINSINSYNSEYGYIPKAIGGNYILWTNHSRIVLSDQNGIVIFQPPISNIYSGGIDYINQKLYLSDSNSTLWIYKFDGTLIATKSTTIPSIGMIYVSPDGCFAISTSSYGIAFLKSDGSTMTCSNTFSPNLFSRVLY